MQFLHSLDRLIIVNNHPLQRFFVENLLNLMMKTSPNDKKNEKKKYFSIKTNTEDIHSIQTNSIFKVRYPFLPFFSITS